MDAPVGAERRVDQLERLNATLSMVSRASSVLVHARSEQLLYAGMCEAITAERSGFLLAWVGVPREAPGKPVEVVAFAGPASGYLGGIHVAWDDSPQGMGPTGRTIRTGEVQYNNHMIDSRQFQPWRERARAYGLESSFSLPIKLADGQVVAALMVYAAHPDAFGDAELALLGQLSADLGYGVQALRTRSAYERALGASVDALARTLEWRDPYTAGHGRRVADLTVAIARRLGYSEPRIEGLRLAAMVHDIGKIRVPLEILVYPGKLNETEHKLIQIHPGVGFDVLAQIDYPWPVAQTVLQHHERLDGSGYPNGLRGEQILPEARIIAVADVVESMASHRPYRAALGIDAALAEIRRQSPHKLDAEVVTACVELFESGRFRFDAGAARVDPAAAPGSRQDARGPA